MFVLMLTQRTLWTYYMDVACAVDKYPYRHAEGDPLKEVIADRIRRHKLVTKDALPSPVSDHAGSPAYIDDNNLKLKGVRMTSQPSFPSKRAVEAEFIQTLMQSNYNLVSIAVSSPYMYSHETSYTNTETQKTVLVSSRYLFNPPAGPDPPPVIALTLQSSHRLPGTSRRVLRSPVYLPSVSPWLRPSLMGTANERRSLQP
ncbi:hypothetical protein C8Q80DRAFT_1350403 [Daedaleopsis nitida]|nr:hypothetical protein C8Q80DRAFT_1350403 [Daedaleopsis nitida]